MFISVKSFKVNNCKKSIIGTWLLQLYVIVTVLMSDFIYETIFNTTLTYNHQVSLLTELPTCRHRATLLSICSSQTHFILFLFLVSNNLQGHA